MDRPRPPHPFTHPPERSLAHNHNHNHHAHPVHAVHTTQSSEQAPPYASNNIYPPTSASSQQPPLHVPFSADPYPTARRDPFLPPTSQHVRRSSYGVHPAESAPPPASSERAGAWANTARPHGNMHHASHQHPQSGPPPPPPSMSSSHPPSGPSPYGYDSARRRSLGGQSPPNPYGGKAPHTPCEPVSPNSRKFKLKLSSPCIAPSHDAPPPPPPSFARPHMPPPSSPQQQQQQQQHQQHNSHAPSQQPQRAPYSAANNFGRELPGLAQAHRPGSSMSISSLIGGGDTGAPTHSSQSQSSPPSAAQPSNHHSMQPPSPRRQLSSGQRSEFPPFRRQPSPERHPHPNPASRPPEAYGYPAGSPPRNYSNQGSPEQGRPQSLPQTSQPYKPMVFQNQRPYTSSPNDAHARDSRQSSGGIPPRPNSQPTGPPGPQEQDPRAVYDALGRRTTYGPPEERRRTLGESHHSRPNAAELLAGTPQAASDRDRPVTVQPVSHSVFSPPRDHRSGMPAGPGQQPLHKVWRHSAPEDALRESAESRREEPPMYRGYGGYPPASQAPPPQYSGHGGAEDMVRGRSLDHLSHRVVEQYHAPPTSDPTSNDRQRPEQLSRSLSSGGNYPGRSMYDQPRRMGEEMQLSKSHLGLEASRKTGRASPLPQAVQGAQAQPLSIGKDPGIKSEFGRMFSGLGSGLGASTPSRGSPMPQGGQESIPPGTDLTEILRLQRVNSQNGRKTKRVKDEEGMVDSESIDGRGTPSLRGAKRNKHNHPGHHHHHHAHGHHHHHHHHRPEDEIPPPTTSTPLNGRPATVPANGTSKGSAHHHHHYHGNAHHHHHAPPNQAGPPLSPTKIPPKVHDIQSVLDEAAKLPRRHLGSHLYEATTHLPKPNSSLDDQFGYASKPNRLPRFESNPINCTFTIRVPRFYLKPRQRQQIVLERHIWGARIYRDDSDPIAAAIHSGWIRGEWDDTVDVSMLDPRITAPNDPSDAEATLTKLPAAPVTPPADMDLQIEILILPRVQEYAGTVEYGISSQKSKTHDGLSFVIHKIRWVEEGIGSRGQERTAAALKRRLDASATLLALKSGVDDSFRAVNGSTKLHA